MSSITHALHTAGSAAGARARAHQELGYGWPSVNADFGVSCNGSVFQASASNPMAFMAITGTKRPPRRLGQRST